MAHPIMPHALRKKPPLGKSREDGKHEEASLISMIATIITVFGSMGALFIFFLSCLYLLQTWEKPNTLFQSA